MFEKRIGARELKNISYPYVVGSLICTQNQDKHQLCCHNAGYVSFCNPGITGKLQRKFLDTCK